MMLGYTESQINRMINSIEVAYEIIDGPTHIESDLIMAVDFLEGILAEGHI